MSVFLHEEDLPADVAFADGPIAVDTEAMGLLPGRDRLCLVQLHDGEKPATCAMGSNRRSGASWWP